MSTQTMSEILTWVRKRREQLRARHQSVRLPELAREALQEPQFNAQFWRRFAEENAYPLIYAELQKAFMPSAAVAAARSGQKPKSIFAYLDRWSESCAPRQKIFLRARTHPGNDLTVTRRRQKTTSPPPARGS
jgi:hypothetical protein